MCLVALFSHVVCQIDLAQDGPIRMSLLSIWNWGLEALVHLCNHLKEGEETQEL